MQNKKLIILIVLGIIAILSLIRGILTPSKIRREIASKSAIIQAKQPPTTIKKVTPFTRGAKRSSYTSWGRSPFIPASAGAKVTELNLNGILWDKKTPLAIINNKMVGIGDKVEGNTVMDIKPDSVILNDGVNNFELKLGLKINEW